MAIFQKNTKIQFYFSKCFILVQKSKKAFFCKCCIFLSPSVHVQRTESLRLADCGPPGPAHPSACLRPAGGHAAVPLPAYLRSVVIWLPAQPGPADKEHPGRTLDTG